MVSICIFSFKDFAYNIFGNKIQFSTLKTKMCVINHGFSHQFMNLSYFALLGKGLHLPAMMGLHNKHTVGMA